MFDAQIAQKVSFSPMLPDRLPSKPEPNPHEYYNCVTVMEEVEGLTNPVDIPM